MIVLDWFYPRLALWASLAERTATLRVGSHLFLVKPPESAPLFSERHGLDTILLRAGGWRLIHRIRKVTGQ